MDNETSNLNFMLTEELMTNLNDEQKHNVFTSERCSIDGEFIGFIEHYHALHNVIPKDWTVIDLGCAYAPQSYYFKDHKAYIGVDSLVDIRHRFYTENTTHIVSTIEEFIQNIDAMELDLNEVFAICSYVPNWEAKNRELVRHHFENVYTFYPYSSHKLIVPKGVEK